MVNIQAKNAPPPHHFEKQGGNKRFLLSRILKQGRNRKMVKGKHKEVCPKYLLIQRVQDDYQL